MSASCDVLQNQKEAEIKLETDTTSGSGSSVLKKYLVACYLLVQPVRYDFHFYPTEDILKSSSRASSYLRNPPERVIRWGPPDYSRRNPSQNQYLSYPSLFFPNPRMNFLYSSKVDKDWVYALGGLIHTDGCLPKEFARIPLSVPSSPQVVKTVMPQLLTSTTVGKVHPLIVEMGGSIFALSSPSPPTAASNIISETATFEVYDPKNCGWNTLPSPPLFSRKPHLEYIPHFVVDDKKLFVSDGIRSWSFDSKSWKGCNLFYDFFPNIKLPWIDYQYGFPFRGEAILWKDNIYLCIIPAQTPPIAAFSFSIGQKKATRVELDFGECDLFKWGGVFMHLVNMGDDHVAVDYYDDEDEYEGRGCSTTIVMFKLFKTKNGASATCAGERRYHGNRLGDYKAKYCFAFD